MPHPPLVALSLALLGTNLADPPSGDAVYTHVFGGGIMVWSANTGRGLALFVLLWLFLALRRANHAGVERKEIAAAGLLGGSGFLAVYLFGLIVANRAAEAVAPTLAAMVKSRSPQYHVRHYFLRKQACLNWFRQEAG